LVERRMSLSLAQAGLAVARQHTAAVAASEGSSLAEAVEAHQGRRL
jgi:hypothetical protein